VSKEPSKPLWLVRCSCGWRTTLSAEWAAQSAAKVHARLAWTAKEHAVSVEQQPREAEDQTEEEQRERDQ
jgi:hypothetical protein